MVDRYPTAVERVDDARAIYRRVLANWVSDLLVLRREGQLRGNWPAPRKPWDGPSRLIHRSLLDASSPNAFDQEHPWAALQPASG